MSETLKMVMPKATFSVHMPALSTLDPAMMSDAEHVAHFGWSRRDEAIEEEVQCRLMRRSLMPSPTELTEEDKQVARQLGISEKAMRAQKEGDAKISLSRSGDQGRERALKDLAKVFPSHSRAELVAMIEAGRGED